MMSSTTFLLASDFGFLLRELCFLWPFLLLGYLFGFAAAYFHWYRSVRPLRIEAEAENMRLREGLLIAKRAAPELQKQRLVEKKLSVAVGEGKVLRQHVQKLASKVSQRDRELVSFAQKVTKHEEEVAIQRNKNHESQAAVRMLTESINERNSEISGLERRVGEERNQRELTAKTLGEKEAELEVIQEKVNAANSQKENEVQRQSTKLEEANVQLASVRQQYESLKIDAESRKTKQDLEISELTNRLADVQKASKSAGGDVSTLKQDLGAKDKEIAELKVTANTKDADIKLLLAELETLEGKVGKDDGSSKDWEELIADKNAEIRRLEALLASKSSNTGGVKVVQTVEKSSVSKDPDDAWLEKHQTLGLIYSQRPSRLDDLTRIKGVGNVIEKKLHGFGVYRFKQIVEWSPETVDAFSEQLDFKGRIEREEWVSQAKKLMS